MTSIIKVNTFQDTNGNALFSSDGSGNVTDNNLLAPSFNAQLSSNQSLSNDTWTKAQLSNEIYDTNSAFDSSTNYRFTVPTGLGGKYLFQYCALISDINDTKRGEARFYKNGSAYSYGRNNNMSSGTGASLYCTGSAIITMSAGDYLELYVYQNNGNAQAVYSSATFLSGFKILGA